VLLADSEQGFFLPVFRASARPRLFRSFVLDLS
jgi:hypothetical protein